MRAASRLKAQLLTAAALLPVAGCLSPQPHAMITVEDPLELAAAATTLAAGVELSTLQVQQLPPGTPFPLTVLVTHAGEDSAAVWIEVRRDDAQTLGRGRVDVEFRRRDAPTAVVALRRACEVDGDCDDDLYCTGSEACEDHMCKSGAAPCGTSYPCVMAVCEELSGGAGRCALRVDHGLCPEGTYCDPVTGCTRGQGCNGDDAECQDGSFCNGQERCVGFRCEPGALPSLDDGDGCTLDGCNDALAGAGEAPVFHVPQPERDGFACRNAAGEPGACLAAAGGCVPCETSFACGASCAPCTGETPECGGAIIGCICTDTSCGIGRRCLGGACVPCDTADHCGFACVACAAPTPLCGGAEQGCITADCAVAPDLTTCATAGAPDRSYDICVGGACVSPGCHHPSCNPTGPGFALPDTGLRTCFGHGIEIACPTATPCESAAYCGQDAQYGRDAVTEAPPRLVAVMTTSATQRVVLDQVTGLMWQGCAGGMLGASCETVGALELTYDEALAYCDALVWAGYVDWRLPSYHELLSIVDAGRFEPAIDPDAFPHTPFVAAPGDGFWTSTYDSWSYGFELLGGDPKMRVVSFRWGSGWASDDLGAGHWLRCARTHARTASLRAPRFEVVTTVPSEPVVIDHATSRVWQGCTAGRSGVACETAAGSATFTWQQALALCEGSTWAGHSDWRLPDRTELASLLDLTRDNPSIDEAAFPRTDGDATWTSSGTFQRYFLTNEYYAAWAVSFLDAEVAAAIMTMPLRVRCVRDED